MKMFCFRIIIIIFYVRNCNIYYISNMINIPFTIMNYELYRCMSLLAIISVILEIKISM